MIIKAHENAAFLPATDEDGDWSCLTVTWEPTPDELVWALWDDETSPTGDQGGHTQTGGLLRAGYLIYKAAQAYQRSAAEGGFEPGWRD